MSIDKRTIYTAGGLLACVLLFTCTKVSFEDPFTGEDALAVPIITVLGDDPYKLNVNDTYCEPGATAIDTCDGDTTDITDSIEIKDGSVSTDAPGEHTIKYYARGLNGIQAKKERRVVVTEITGPDTEKPIITILGLNPKILFIGETYTEEGATAYDSVDGNLTDEIVTYGDNVTTDELDSFEVWYMVTDKAGNIARKKRDIYIWEGGDRPPELTLLGDPQVIIYLYEDFVDPGATAWDEVDGDLTDKIVIIDSVNNTVQGIYPVRYKVSDKAGNTTKKDRYVTVLNWADTIPPVITLLGDSILKVGAGGSFQDPGATALDNVDGDISNRIQDSGSVDMQKVGSYNVYYNVEDGAGNKAEEKRRTVSVVDTIGPTIAINPPNPINIYVGTAYHEWGATAYDNLDGDITSILDTVGFVNVNTNDSVDVHTGGQYRVHYRVTDNAGHKTDSIRIVNVADFADTVPPIITLNGQNPMNLDVGDSYNEPGATAWDNKDGDISDSIDIKDTINTSVQGAYRAHYRVSDQDGNAAHEIRTVYVGITGGDSITIGTGSTTGQHLPMECFYGYTYTESIYLKSELNVPGPITIDSIGYYYNGGGSFSDAIRVYMGNTSKSSYTSNQDWVSSGSMTQVYNGNYPVGSSAGWYKIRFSTPFTYNNSNNLVIAFDENTNGYHSDSDEFRCSSKSATRSKYFYSDNTDPNPSGPPTTGDGINTFIGGNSYCPNIKIFYH